MQVLVETAWCDGQQVDGRAVEGLAKVGEQVAEVGGVSELGVAGEAALDTEVGLEGAEQWVVEASAGACGWSAALS